MYGEIPFVSYTVCVNHVVEKVVSCTGGTVVYNTNIFLGAVVEAAEMPWKLRKLPWKQNIKFRGCSFQLFLKATSKSFTAFVEAAELPTFRGSCRLLA